MEARITAPVLLIAFNRPDTTKIVFDKIRDAKPLKLYVAVDGPRESKEGEAALVKEVRKIVQSVDWECEPHYRFLDDNLGCGHGVSSAITWAFENEDRLIILEDDCVPVLPFFSYCNTLLEKYKDDFRICLISGNNYTEDSNAIDANYFFSKYGHIWGWATWKRAWNKFDYEMNDWPLFRNTNQICNVFKDKREQQYFLNFYNKFFIKEEKGTWDYQWFYCRIKDYGLSIVPSHNLVSNIGFYGVHTNKQSKAHLKSVNENFKITNEPQFILCNSKYDSYHFRKHINKRKTIVHGIFTKIINIIRGIFQKHVSE